MSQNERRNFLKNSMITFMGLTSLSWLDEMFLKQAMANVVKPQKKKTLVFIFMRGAADSLALISPLKDSFYKKDMRPNLFMSEEQMLNLDGFFYLHQAFKELLPFWNNSQMAIVHQTGIPHGSRSHFDAQDFLETGTPNIKSTESGFLNRFAQSLNTSGSPLQLVALQTNLPRSLWGDKSSFAMNSLSEFQGKKSLTSMKGGTNFESMYSDALDSALRGTSEKTFESLDILKSIPTSNAQYPNSKLAKHLSDAARLIKGNIGTEIIVTECGGCDTHQRQGTDKGQLFSKASDLSQSLSAFLNDLGTSLNDVCVVCMSEFGRTVKENGNQGTDHGTGGAMMIFSGDVKKLGFESKKVQAKWIDLKTSNLFEERDLPITTDARTIWAQLLIKHFEVSKSSLKDTFPAFENI